MPTKWLKTSKCKLQSFHEYDPVLTIYLFNIGKRKGLKHWELWQGFIVQGDELIFTDTFGSVTSAKQKLLFTAKTVYDHEACQVVKTTLAPHVGADQSELNFDEVIIEKTVTHHSKEKKTKSGSKAKNELNCAMWFIDTMGSVERAEQVFAAAVAATKVLEVK